MVSNHKNDQRMLAPSVPDPTPESSQAIFWGHQASVLTCFDQPNGSQIEDPENQLDERSLTKLWGYRINQQ
jgi:hypothetical protein